MASLSTAISLLADRSQRPRLSIAGEWGSEQWQRAVATQCSPKMQWALWQWHAQHPFEFIRDCVKVVGKDKRLQPLDIDHPDYRRAQRYFAEEVLRQLTTTGRVRLEILKARQWGCTTLANALLLWLMIFHPHSECLTLADKTKKGEGILRMLKRMHAQLPD
jgi:hypothetical protein